MADPGIYSVYIFLIIFSFFIYLVLSEHFTYNLKLFFMVSIYVCFLNFIFDLWFMFRFSEFHFIQLLDN